MAAQMACISGQTEGQVHKLGKPFNNFLYHVSNSPNLILHVSLIIYFSNIYSNTSTHTLKEIYVRFPRWHLEYELSSTSLPWVSHIWKFFANCHIALTLLAGQLSFLTTRSHNLGSLMPIASFK